MVRPCGCWMASRSAGTRTARRHGEDSLALQTDVEGMTARIQQYPPPIGARLLGRLAGTEVERLLLCFVEIVDIQIEVVALRVQTPRASRARCSRAPSRIRC